MKSERSDMEFSAINMQFDASDMEFGWSDMPLASGHREWEAGDKIRPAVARYTIALTGNLPPLTDRANGRTGAGSVA